SWRRWRASRWRRSRRARARRWKRSGSAEPGDESHRTGQRAGPRTERHEVPAGRLRLVPEETPGPLLTEEGRQRRAAGGGVLLGIVEIVGELESRAEAVA